jgi:putative DNA methylase
MTSMPEKFIKTKPSLMEAGLPCSSLSAECQSDNDARQRPPQNRLHIWWARRPPTVCRVANLTALLPHDASLATEATRDLDPPVSEADLDNLSAKQREHAEFYRKLLAEIPPTPLADKHRQLLLLLRAFGDPARFAEQRAAAREAGVPLPKAFSRYLSGNRDTSIPESLLLHLRSVWRQTFNLAEGEAPVLLDFMAGGGAIPLEGIRYGLKVYANELNPVAATVLKATLEYPARFGNRLAPILRTLAADIAAKVRARLERFFPFPPVEEWWPDVEPAARAKFRAKDILRIEPGDTARQIKNSYLWCRTIRCPKCQLLIPLSTNFTLDTKGKPATHKAVFPEPPALGQRNECTFRMVAAGEWSICRWPRLGNTPWHPKDTPTFRDGAAICPRCVNTVIDPADVKAIARTRAGGLPSQMYAVCSQVPVRLICKDGAVKARYLWRFRPPTVADLAAVSSAEKELQDNESRLTHLIPPEEVPDVMEDKRPREYGITRWRDFFLPRQLLTNAVVLEEVRAAQAKARAELSSDEAEAVAVYLTFIVSKVVNYNSVNTFWHYGRRTVTQTFSRHDFAFRPAFCEFEGAREPVMWGAIQVINAYAELAGLVHGEAMSLESGDDDEEGADDPEQEEIASEPEAETEEDTGEGLPVINVAVNGQIHTRPEVIVPTVTCNDAAALDTPAPGTVHLICVDPPYYQNLQYSELSNFFYVWLKRALHDWPGLKHLFQEPLTEHNREAVANAARWKREADVDTAVWQEKYDAALAALQDTRGENKRKLTKAVRQAMAAEKAGPKPPSATDRADKFYEDKMAAVFRRGQQLLHPVGRMVVMFNHKQTRAWRSLGAALIREKFEIRTSVPIHTEAESSLNIRGLDAARSTVLLLCTPREETAQVPGNWGRVQNEISLKARKAAELFESQGLSGTDLYLSALGPALHEVARHWPITNMAGQPIDLQVALDEAYRAVGQYRLEQILAELTEIATFADVGANFAADTADKNTRTL